MNDAVCHCGLPLEDHRLGGAAEHNYLPKSEMPMNTPPCRVCGKTEPVLVYPDAHEQTICPECCGKTEEGHDWRYDEWERDKVYQHCGIQRRCTEYAHDDYDYD